MQQVLTVFPSVGVQHASSCYLRQRLKNCFSGRHDVSWVQQSLRHIDWLADHLDAESLPGSVTESKKAEGAHKGLVHGAFIRAASVHKTGELCPGICSITVVCIHLAKSGSHRCATQLPGPTGMLIPAHSGFVLLEVVANAMILE